MDPKAIVRAGYDRVSLAYREDSFTLEGSSYGEWLGDLVPRLAPGSAVLDLGCGCGVPVAQALAARFAVTGVDLSPVQIERARRLAPEAELLCADMSEVEFEPGRFAAVVAFYSIIHLPLDEQPRLFTKISRWLTPGGLLMATVGHAAWTGLEENWRGVPGGTMYWSHADAGLYDRWLRDRGFAIEWTRFVPEDDGGHTLVLARAPGGLR